MNDRFKFRAWDTFKEEMIKNHISVCEGELYEWFSDGFHTKHDIGESAILMQCTGLKDKNGKLIYEGDILLEKNGKHHVVNWNNNHATFFIEQIEKTGHFDTWHLARHDLDYEVIGNIYENKELLNEQF